MGEDHFISFPSIILSLPRTGISNCCPHWQTACLREGTSGPNGPGMLSTELSLVSGVHQFFVNSSEV